MIMVTVFVWSPLSSLWQHGLHRTISREHWVSIAILVIILSLGLGGVVAGPYVPGELWNRLITLLAAFIGGPSAGAAVGTALSWVIGLHGVTPLGGAGLYAISGLLAGLFAPRGKFGISVGFVTGHLLLSIQTADPSDIVRSFMHGFVALAIFSLLPNGWLRFMERALPGSRAREQYTTIREERLKSMIAQRFIDMSRLFSTMSLAFRTHGDAAKHTSAVGYGKKQQGANQTQVNEIVKQVTEELCVHCPGYKTCWQEHVSDTYRSVVRFMAYGEQDGILKENMMPHSLRKRCFRPAQIRHALVRAMAMAEEREHWRTKWTAQNELVGRQLGEVASFVDELAHDVHIDIGRADEMQVVLLGKLQDAAYAVERVAVRALGDEAKRFEVTVTQRVTKEKRGWEHDIQAIVSKAINKPFYIRHEEEHAGSGLRRIVLAQQPVFSVEHAEIVQPKHPDGVSGDSVLSATLADGRIVYMVSDGMGHGPTAASVSRAAITVFRSLLEAGFTLRRAVRSVNAFLLARDGGEMFASLDIVVIDRFTGIAQFLKVGSPASYIKRHSHIDIVRCGDAPVGAIADIDVRVQQRQLYPGDTIVVATDGVFDSVQSVTDKEAWFSRILSHQPTTKAQLFARNFVQRVAKKTDGAWSDDATVVVIQLYTVEGARKRRASGPDIADVHAVAR